MTHWIQVTLLGTVTREQGEKGWRTNNKINDSANELCLEIPKIKLLPEQAVPQKEEKKSIRGTDTVPQLLFPH